MCDKAAISNTFYEQDFYAWANEQAWLLRAERLTDADIEHIAEEIESMGKTEKRELVSRFKVVLTHQLKWHYQPTHRGIVAGDNAADNPSLKAVFGQSLADRYGDAAI
jgi:hypothetical protein